MNVQITSYSVTLQTDEFCYLCLISSDGRTYNIKPKNLYHLNTYVELLRNENPIFFEPSRQVLFTGKEPVGEADLGK